MATYTGDNSDNVITGGPGDDTIFGAGGNDTLDGSSGNDTLDGGSGNDVMRGRTGNDYYMIDSASDRVIESVGEGFDQAFSTVSFTLEAGSEIEALRLSDAGAVTALNLTGNEFGQILSGNAGNNSLSGRGGDDYLEGRAGDDTLDGGTGNDVMRGGTGNDYYFIDTAADRVLEASAEGYDTAFTTVSFTVEAGSDLDALRVLDSAGVAAINLTGNEFGQVLSGNAGSNVLNGGGGDDYLEGRGGNDTLDGGSGGDVMRGGTGDDYYIVDSASDRILEAAGEGFDQAFVTTSFALEGGSQVDAVRASDPAALAAINLTGNELGQILSGNAGANVLSGLGGDDYLEGRGGADTLDGGTGADVMRGGTGGDYYFVDSASDRVIEGSGEGYDVAFTTVGFTLEAGSELEELRLLDSAGTAALNLTGNEFAQVLSGNAGANVLKGGGGDDYLEGRAGDDTLDGGVGSDVMRGGVGGDYYFVDSASDRVIEASGEGNDSVFTAVSFALEAGSEVEALRVLDDAGSAAINLTGNELAQILSGNAGVNVLNGGGGDDYIEGRGGDDSLNGGTGADVLRGGIGNDTYYVDSTADRVLEGTGEGYDTLVTASSFTLEAGSEVEDLKTADASATVAINLTGNEFGQILTGNAGANVLNGGGGNDTLNGGAGNDVLDGGTGTNNLTGGSGADQFAFSSALTGNITTVTDFDGASGDRFVLAGDVGQAFQGLATGTVVADDWSSGAAVSTVFTYGHGAIRYDSSTGVISYSAGGQTPVQFAKVAVGTAPNSLSFTATGAPDHAPVITSGSTASVQENSATSTIVYQVAATDQDGDSLTYELHGLDASAFTIDTSGAVRLRQSADYETKASYAFEVWAVESNGTTAQKAVTLTVGDLSETLPPYVISEVGVSDDTRADAILLDRARFSVTSNSALPDPSLPSAQVNGSVSAPSDVDYFKVVLNAGELLILDIDGTTTLDSMVKVFDGYGTELAMNDDAVVFDTGSSAHTGVSHNMDSLVRFRAPSTGTYYFSVQSYADDTGPTSSGAYTLNVSIGPPATPAQLIEENIQALLSGASWDTLNLSYSFPTLISQYEPDAATDERSTFQPLLAAQQAAVTSVLAYASTLTNLSFTLNSSSPGSAQLRYARTEDGDTAHAYYPGSGDGGDAWFNAVNGEYDNPVRGNYAWTTFLHETGHALGLKHGHESPALSSAQDYLAYSVMTYRSYPGASVGADGGYTNEQWGYPQTYMMYDIAALQRLYGADFGTNSGNNTYTWDPSSGAFRIDGATQWTPGGNRIFMTIWDGGGTDTYDLSNYTSGVGLSIDLRPGEWSKFSSVQVAYLGDGNYAPGNVANALLYNGDARSLIENAVATSGNDIVTGNDAVNRLTGGAGSDVFMFYTVGQSAAGSADTITDFKTGIDDINLTGIDANSTTSADDAFAFLGTGAFTGHAGELRYQTVGSDLHLLGDVNGDGSADLQIILFGAASISSGDLLL